MVPDLMRRFRSALSTAALERHPILIDYCEVILLKTEGHMVQRPQLIRMRKRNLRGSVYPENVVKKGGWEDVMVVGPA